MELARSAVLERAHRTAAPQRGDRWIPVSELDFVGCKPYRMTLAEYDASGDERVEFFDSESELAWMVREPGGRNHEAAARMLGPLLDRIAMLRGSPIRCLGESQLRLVGADGRRVRSIHPDETVFLHPERLDLPGREHFRVGEDEFPDVVLEVDHTTDVRRNRLKLYEEWGFPEVWVEVPDAYSPSRPKGLKPGLRIHLLEKDRYVASEESRALPGWRADEIHRALNELFLTKETSAVLARVGRALGEREGTGPDDDPLLHSSRAEARAEGVAVGRAGLLRRMLLSRGIEVSGSFPSAQHRAALAGASDEAVLAAASAAHSETDFFARLSRSQS